MKGCGRLSWDGYILGIALCGNAMRYVHRRDCLACQVNCAHATRTGQAIARLQAMREGASNG